MWTQNATQIFSYDESIAGGLRKRRGTKGKVKHFGCLKRRDYRKCQDLAFGASLKDSICLIRAKLTPNHMPGISDRGGHCHTGTILKRTQLSSLKSDRDKCLNVCPAAAEGRAGLSGRSSKVNSASPWCSFIKLSFLYSLSHFIRNALVQSVHQTISSWTAGWGRWNISQQDVRHYHFKQRSLRTYIYETLPVRSNDHVFLI